MRLRVFGVIPLVIFGLSACGQDLCDKLAKDAEDCGETVDDSDLDECKESLSSCSKSDEKAFEDFFDCFRDAGFLECEDTTTTTTTTSTGSTTGMEDLEALFACAELVKDVSSECQQAMGGMGSSTGTYTYTTGSGT